MLRRELEVLGTRESTLDRREANLYRERNGLEDAHAQIFTCELDTDSQEAGLRGQEARLVAQERQLVEQQMQKLAVTQKGLDDLQVSHAGEA
jgi:hypothetical protein